MELPVSMYDPKTFSWKLPPKGFNDGDGGEPEKDIVYISPLPAGWFAVYDGSNDNEIVVFPIVSIGLYDVYEVLEDGSSHTLRQEIKHFVSLPLSGAIVPIDDVEGLLCVVAPGQNLEKLIEVAKTQRAANAKNTSLS